MDKYSEKTTTKLDNNYLLKQQLETVKVFYEKGVLSKEMYEYEVKTLNSKIKTDK